MPFGIRVALVRRAVDSTELIEVVGVEVDALLPLQVVTGALCLIAVVVPGARINVVTPTC